MSVPPPGVPDDRAHDLHARARPFLNASIGDGPGVDATSAAPGLRPFVLTSGRVEGAHSDIRIESQVATRPDRPGPRSPGLAPECQAIVALCAEPVSVAEISARLRLHLGVAMVLVGDLSAAGHVEVQTTDAHNIDDPNTILRVIRGLRAIS